MRKILSLLMMVAFSVAMFANSYWYRGVDNSWGATAMTESTDGLYEYIQSSNNANQFKIATSEDSWDYGWTYVQAGFNSTDVTNIGDYGQDNCYCWQSGDYYILVYYPNTAVNTTANPIICAATTLPEAAGDPNQMYVWNGIGVTTAAAATELGGAAEAVQADDKNNIVAGASQKGNWCLKANKGFTNGAYYLGIAMNNGVNAGDTIKIAYFRTTSKNTYVLGMDFSADKASAATTYQILSQGDPQTLESNGTPADSIFIVPEGVENAKYMRIYRNTGGTGLWVAKVEVVKKAGETPEQPEQPEENVLPVVKLAGSLTSWEEPVLMANAEDSLSATLTLNLGIDHYQLKVVSDGNWLSKAGDGDLYTMHRDWNHVDHLDLINTGDNIKLITDVEGAYTFTWTYADSTLVVTFPEAPAQPKFYITGNEDIVGEGNPTWGKNGALESFSDTLVMNLAAGQHKFKLITPAEQWLGMEALTDTAYGLFTDDDTNICFALAEAGAVTVIYNATEFKVEGNFYVAPKVAYYLIGDSAFVVDAGATADKAWTPDAIASFKDTTVLHLKAGVNYIMRLSLEGTWENHRDFRHLTDTAVGLIELPDEFGNHSIGFSLAEAGDVTIIYIPAANEQPEVFKLIGNFYVAPAPDPTVAVMGSMNNWAEEIPFVLSDDKTYASLTVENIGADNYEFKFVINGEWRSNGYTYHRGFPGAAGITENNDANMIFQADVDGEYTFYWYFANDSAAIVYPELPFTCDWENIAWLEGSNEQIKVCKESEAVSVINVQKPGWAAEKGIYMTFPSAAWGAISLEEGSYVTEGAGLLVYLSALTQEYNEISIVCQDVEYIINVYNADNMPKPAFYLVGNFNEWTAAEAYKFALNPNNDAEYVLTATLAEKDSLKVIRVMEGEETVWYPADAENYVVDAAHAGEKDIYFRPDYQGGEDWYAQCIYVAENAPQGCDWDHIDFIGSAVPELADQFKLCKEGQYPSVINIQSSFGTEAGIYVTFPSAAFGEISMTEGTYAIQGAGMLLYCSAFTDVETEVSIVCDGNPIIFTVYNAEGSAPVVDPTVSVKGSMNDWAEEIPFVLSDDKTYASLTVENISAGNYEFKFIINGEWRSNGYRYHRGFPGAASITENNEANMTFEADIDGEYTFYWYFANDSAAIVYPAKPEPVLANGYYLVGSMNEWTPAAENLFAQNPDNEFEYQLAINLAVGDEIKVVEVENDAIKKWFPNEGGNYVIDDHHNGATTMYFRPDYQGGEDWFAGCIYVVPTSTVDITNIDANAEAVKVLRNGQIMIIKGTKTYNVMGQILK